jgi:hypothetical protein
LLKTLSEKKIVELVEAQSSTAKPLGQFGHGICKQPGSFMGLKVLKWSLKEHDVRVCAEFS